MFIIVFFLILSYKNYYTFVRIFLSIYRKIEHIRIFYLIGHSVLKVIFKLLLPTWDNFKVFVNIAYIT